MAFASLSTQRWRFLLCGLRHGKNATEMKQILEVGSLFTGFLLLPGNDSDSFSLEPAGTSKMMIFFHWLLFLWLHRFLRFHRCNWANVHCKQFPSQLGISSQRWWCFSKPSPRCPRNVEIKELARNLPRCMVGKWLLVEAWKCHNSPSNKKSEVSPKKKFRNQRSNSFVGGKVWYGKVEGPNG